MEAFFRQNEDAIRRGLEEVGIMLNKKIKAATPVITGHLRDSNDYEVDDAVLYLYNTADYAHYVELGTIFQVSQPFIRKTMYDNVSGITKIIKSSLGV